jgi:hypothetical protein
MTPEKELRQKLRRIEALYAGATTEGERLAAQAAIDRIRKRLAEFERTERPIEYTFKLADGWSLRLFIALCRRYGLEPYRYARQRRTTVNIRAPRSFVDKTLWPEYQEIQKALQDYLLEATNRIIREEVFGNGSDIRER